MGIQRLPLELLTNRNKNAMRTALSDLCLLLPIKLGSWNVYADSWRLTRSSGSLHTDRCCAYLSVQEPRVWRGSPTRPDKCLLAWTWDVASLKHMHNERISLIESLLEPRWLRLLFKGSEWKGSRRHGTIWVSSFISVQVLFDFVLKLCSQCTQMPHSWLKTFIKNFTCCRIDNQSVIQPS